MADHSEPQGSSSPSSPLALVLKSLVGKSLTIKQIQNVVQKTNPRISWHDINDALVYWIRAGVVRATNKRFWIWNKSYLEVTALMKQVG